MQCVIVLHFIDGTTKTVTLESFEEGSIFLGLCQHGILHNGVRHELLDHYFDMDTQNNRIDGTVHAKFGTKAQVTAKVRKEAAEAKKVLIDSFFTEEPNDEPQLNLPFSVKKDGGETLN